MTPQARRERAEQAAERMITMFHPYYLTRTALLAVTDALLTFADQEVRAERERISTEALLWAHLSSSRSVTSTLESFAKALLDGKGPFDDERLNEFMRSRRQPPAPPEKESA